MPPPLEEMQAVLASAPRHRRWGSGHAIQSLADEATRIRTSLGALSAARHRLLPAGREGPDDGAVTALDAIAGPAARLLESLRAAIQRDRPPEVLAAPHEAIHRAELTLRGLLVPATGESVMVQRGDLDVALALHGQLRAAERIMAAGIGITSTEPGGPPRTAKPWTSALRRAAATPCC